MLELYDVVKLKNDDLAFGVKKTYLGTVVDVLDGGAAFTVEFVNENGETVIDALLKEYKPDELIQLEKGTEYL